MKATMASIGEGSETFPSVSRSLSTKPFTYTGLQTLRVTVLEPTMVSCNCQSLLKNRSVTVEPTVSVT